MRPLRALVIYIVVVFLGGALLAPWLYWLAQAGAATFPKLVDAPFHRFVSRSLQVLALAGLWPLLRGLGARSAADLGLVKPTGHWRKMFAGFLLGFTSLAVLGVLALVGGGRVLEQHLALAEVSKELLAGALTAITVGVLEEIFFRGGIHGGLRRVLDWRYALGMSSMIYAIVHFFARTKDPASVNWLSGLDQLGLMLRGFTDWQQIVPGFFNLSLVGAILAFAYQRTGNLFFSIGLHAGWIFSLRSYTVLTKSAPHTNVWLWGSSRLIDSWLALVVLLLTLIVVLRLQPASHKRESDTGNPCCS
jgi:uncharacterized protein